MRITSHDIKIYRGNMTLIDVHNYALLFMFIGIGSHTSYKLQTWRYLSFVLKLVWTNLAYIGLPLYLNSSIEYGNSCGCSYKCIGWRFPGHYPVQMWGKKLIIFSFIFQIRVKLKIKSLRQFNVAEKGVQRIL